MNLAAIVPGSAKARRMLGLAFIAQACTTGVVLGAYGSLIPGIEAKFGTTRALSSLGPALCALMLGLLAPIVGVILQKGGARRLLASGAGLISAGFLGVTFASSIEVFLVLFALVIGIGMAAMTVVTPATLVSRWYHGRRGYVLALLNLPIGLIVIPPVAAAVVNGPGLDAWFIGCGALFLILVPVMAFGVIDQPDQVGERPFGQAEADAGQLLTPTVTPLSLLVAPKFWLLTIGVAIPSGAANAFLTHAAPYAMMNNVPPAAAALMITAFGASGLLGTPFFGWLADRIGSVPALALSAFIQSLLWVALTFSNTLPSLIGVAILLGICCTSTNALHVAAINEVFGPRNVSSVIGIGYFFKLPFIFGGPLMAGYLFDQTGGYQSPFLVFAIGMVITAGIFVALSRSMRTVAASPGRVTN